MYTKEQTARQKQAFWTAFGKYMQPIPSAEGTPISWINYKTGIPGIQFKMDADHKTATVSIVLNHKDTALQSLQFDKLTQLKPIFLEALEGEAWDWKKHQIIEGGKTISTISKTLPGVNIHRQEDWPAIISFLKQRIIMLDAFWSLVKEGFPSAT